MIKIDLLFFGKGGSGGGADFPNTGGGNDTLPNYQNATIDPNKIYGYALNPNHPVGGHKARVFESALGFNQSNGSQLISEVKAKLPITQAMHKGSNKHGNLFQVDMNITGLNGNTVIVRTGWIIDFGSITPRLTTIYIP